MSIEKMLNATVKLYKATAQAKETKNGGVSKIIANMSTSISIGDTVIIEKIQGFMMVWYKTVEEYKNGGTPEVIINYKNVNANGYAAFVAGDELNNILRAATIRQFNAGFTSVDYNKREADSIGVDPKEYMDMSMKCIQKANELANVNVKETVTPSIINDEERVTLQFNN